MMSTTMQRRKKKSNSKGIFNLNTRNATQKTRARFVCIRPLLFARAALAEEVCQFFFMLRLYSIRIFFVSFGNLCRSFASFSPLPLSNSLSHTHATTLPHTPLPPSYQLLGFVNVDAQNFKGNTALHMAMEYGLVECQRLLVEFGANLELHNTDGFPAFRGISGTLD
jgi:hypothetical protein